MGQPPITMALVVFRLRMAIRKSINGLTRIPANRFAELRVGEVLADSRQRIFPGFKNEAPLLNRCHPNHAIVIQNPRIPTRTNIRRRPFLLEKLSL